MSHFLHYASIPILAVLHFIPVIATFLIAWSDKYVFSKKQLRIGTKLLVAGITAGIHIAAYMLLHKYFWGRWNFLSTVKRIWELDLSYQQIDYFPISFTVRLAIGFITGWVIRLALLKSLNKNTGYLPLSKRKISILFLLFSVLCAASIGILYYGLSGARNIRINELGSSNQDITPAGDYIELYNTGALECSVYRLYLSDDDNLKKYEIPPTTIPAKGFLLIPLGGNTFNISKNGGETITLSDSQGHILDRVTTASLKPDYSYCRHSDGGKSWVRGTATAGYSNEDGLYLWEEAPAFSHPSGFYDTEFELQIQTNGNATVYYTLDGSTPTEASDIYTQPIRVYDRSDEPNQWRNCRQVVTDWEAYTPDETPVDKAFIVRAVAITPEGLASTVVTATYFVDLPQYAEGAVVSLVADPEDLWGENGIYVTGKEYDEWYLGDRVDPAPATNFAQSGRLWEKEADFAYFSHALTFSQPIGLRITGGSSRIRALKSFSLYARKEYAGRDVFDENIFPNLESSRLALRGGYANSICQMLVPDRSISTQSNQRVAVFLNGEFWYNANILEKYDDQYFYAHYGVNPGNLVVIKAGQLEEGKSGDEELRLELYDYIDDNDFTDDDAFAAFCEKVDIQSYIDYMCFNIYIDNLDFTETKNAVWWRSRTKTNSPYEDGKWRFCLYDLDAMEWGDASMWGYQKQAEKNSFSTMPRYTGNLPINQQRIYVALKKNPQFQKQFVLTFMDMVNTNFRPENVLAAISAYGENTKDYLPGNGGTRNIDYYKAFFSERANYIVPYLAEEFGLTGTLETVALSQNIPQGGTVYLNTTQPELTKGQWSGQYYTDYPITIKAVASEGYRFVGWEGTVNSVNPEIQITLSEGGASVNAVFEKNITSE